MIQLDCPEDANTYIHRAGRTARWLIELVLSRSDYWYWPGLSQNIIFFPNTCQDFGKFHFLSSSQVLYPVKKFCVLPNLALYIFGQIPDPENTLPDKCWYDQQRGSVNHMEGNMTKDSYSDVYSIFWSLHSTVPLQPFILNTKPFPASGLIWFSNIANLALSIESKIPEILVGTSNGINYFSLPSDRNIQDQLWWWSTLTVLVISVGRTKKSLSIWQNCCLQYRSLVSCLWEQ